MLIMYFLIIMAGWDTYIIDIWVEENNLNRTIPINQLFSYQGDLYISINKNGYNPQYHGLPKMEQQWELMFLIELG